MSEVETKVLALNDVTWIFNVTENALKVNLKVRAVTANNGGKTNLRDAQPVISQLHGFGGILHWSDWIPGLPVWTQACKQQKQNN